MQEVMSNPPVVVSRTDGSNQNISPKYSDTLQKYLQEIGRYPLLGKIDQLKLSRLAQQGIKIAKDYLINCNLRLVVYIAKDHQHRGVLLLDLIEEGNLGLLHALEKFNPDLGYCFSTYATYWIRHKVERAVMQQGKIVRLPINKQKEINLYLKQAYQFQQATGQWPKPEQLIKGDSKQLKKIKRDLNYTVQTVSLDTPVNSNGEGDLVVADTLHVEEEHCIYSHDLDGQTVLQQMLKGLSQLSEQQRRIIAMRFGLDGESGKTLEDIAQKLELSRERIRQLQNQALVILRTFLEDRGLDPDSVPLP